ncbi:TetR/AcrR family transcriptional regulator [Paenibacillus sp. 19GGS1-52]|uniref:TetR/AcrR family transcriptional regulator n=1 Tax=Paenibacillus sp. 19GGS1-52 TaxID=2758563 RepID=UPI001EFAE846|nr:TetR/AcrR family transcriptional regulator [Paenibacillus sp. 19GGS1-52]ULO06417.1 TetR/AcrR family transcriptional regulator [Paenibacillus sp. 19GGS1-52]
MTKLTSRQLQAIQTKNKIYETSLSLMELHGYDQITIEQICRKAGVSVGSFYNYFKSKNDILIELYSRADEYFEQEVMPHLTEASMPDKIVEYFDFYANFNVSTGIGTMKQLYNSNNSLFIHEGRLMQVFLTQMISTGQAKGEITASQSPEYITEFLFIVARGLIYDWCLHNGEYNLRERMHEMMQPIVGVFREVG